MTRPGRTIATAALLVALVSIPPTLVVGTILIVAPEETPSPVAERISVTTAVADGLTLTRIVDPEGPQRIFVLTLDPASPLTLDVGLPRADLGGTAPLTLIAERHGALAAVNGDYGISSGRPLHLFAMDGELVQTSLINRAGRNFAISADEREMFFGRPDLSIEVARESTGASFEVQRLNDGPPQEGEVAAFTGVAGALEAPPEKGCAVRLVPDGPRRWGPERDGIERDFVAEAVTCHPDELPLAVGDGVLLASADSGLRALDLGTIVPGERVQLRWSLGWPGVLDAIGGSATLLEDGQVVVEKCHLGYECWKHPRTGVGRTADGRVLIVVVDGRREGVSAGLRREEFAAEMLRLGAVDALALDGGGSSEMVVQGGVVNQPSGNEERRLMSALLILPGADPDEPDLGSGPQSEPGSRESTAPG